MKTKLLLLTILVLITHSLFGQSVTSVSLSAEADAYVSSANASLNFGADSLLEVGNSNPSDVRRLFVRYDLSSIPSIAIITNAYFRLKTDLEGPNPKSFTLQMAKDEWVEGDINYNNQPAIETYKKLKINVNYNNPQRQFYVHQHVQLMVTGAHPNNGWMMAMDQEVGYEGSNTFFSREADSPALRPELYIEYYVPFQFSEAVIEHATNSSSLDGSLDVIVTDGPSSPSFQWYDGSTGLAISGATSSTVTNLAPGWYGLEVSGIVGSSEYMAFVVGSKNEPIQIEFNPGPNYIDDAQLKDGPFIRGINQGVFPFGNYGSYTHFLANDGAYTQMRGVMRFRLWMHEDMVVNQADLILVGLSQSTNNSNASTLHLISESWSESLVSYSNIPDYSLTSDLHLSRTTSSTESKTLDLRDYWEIWNNHSTQNFGFLLELDSYTNISAYMRFYSSDDGTASNRPSIQFDLSVEDGYSSSFNDVTELGSIVADMREQPVKNPPYYYKFSTEPNEDITVEYGLIRDSLYGGVLDSNQYFIGDSNELRTFDNLPIGNYYLSVFDNTKTRVLDKEISLTGKMELDDNDGFSLVRNSVKSLKANASSFINVFVSDGSISEANYMPEDLVSKQIFGFLSSTASSKSSISDYSFGFQIENNVVTTIANGVSVGTAIIVGNSFKLLFNEGNVEYKMGEATIYTATLGVDQVYKAGAYAQAADKVTKHDFIAMSKKKFQLNVKDLVHHTCDGQIGSFNFYVTPSYMPVIFDDWESQTAYTMSAYDYSWTIKKGGITVQTGSSGLPSLPNTTTLNNFSTSAPNAGPGIYTITINVNMYFGSVPNYIVVAETITQTVYVGYETEWLDEYKYDFAPNSYSVKRNIDPFVGSSGYARSKNMFVPSQGDCWINFNPVVLNSSMTNGNLMRVTTQGITNTQPSYSDLFSLNFFKTGGSISLILTYLDPFGSPQIQQFNLGAQSNIIVKFESNLMKLFSNDILLISVTKPNTPIILRVNSLVYLEGFNDVVTSFNCAPSQPSNTLGYTELKKELDAGFANSAGGIIKFTFDEEYDIETSHSLALKIYDPLHNLLIETSLQGIISPAGAINAVEIDEYNIDDNRYTVDISGISGLVVDEIYTLEVTTTTQEKLLMKFRYKN